MLANRCGYLKQKVIMKIIFKRLKYENTKTYYAFNFINFVFINTYQVWNVNFTFCNLFLKILKEKK